MSKSDKEMMSAIAALMAQIETANTVIESEPVAAEPSPEAPAKADLNENMWVNMYRMGGSEIPSSFMLWSNNRRQQAWINLFSGDELWGNDVMGAVYLREYGKQTHKFSMAGDVDLDIDGKEVVYTPEQITEMESAVNAAYDEISLDNAAPSETEKLRQVKYGKPTGVLVVFMYDLDENDKLVLKQLPGVQKLRSKINKDQRTHAQWEGKSKDVGTKVILRARWNNGDKNESVNIGHVVPNRPVIVPRTTD